MYSLNELIENIFHLKQPLTLDDLKAAKRIVVKMHPDKSSLPPEYFLFYKRAFEMVVDFYKSEHKQNQVITEDTTNYVADNADDAAAASVTHVLNKMPKNTFQEKFNQLFEENMVQRPDASRNQWFTSTDAQYTATEPVSSKNMAHIFETIKKNQMASQLVVSGELEYVQGNMGTVLYEEDDPALSQTAGGYICSDPFSKLKYEDLRKVHKDQTIFAVGATTHALPQYKSAEQFAQERARQPMTPLERSEAEQMLARREAARQERLWEFNHQSTLRSLENEKKNKNILSAFLQLRN